MFEAASVKFCKSVGEGTLLPAPSIDRAERCKAFQVVVKKNRKWYSWQSPGYEPSPFTLSQLLKAEDRHGIEEVTATDRYLLTYNKTHQLSINGKLGAQIKSLLDVELEGSDSVDVEAKFGDVSKTEVEQTKLMTFVASRHLDLNHDFVKQVRESSRKVLTVIVGQCWLKDKATVTAKRSVKASEKLEEDKVPMLPAHEEVDVDNEDDKTIVLPSGTCVAYSVCELQVAGDGALTLCIDGHTNGGFTDEDDADGACRAHITPEPEIDVICKDIFELCEKERIKLRTSLLHLCQYPADVDTCLELLKQARKLGATAEGAVAVSKTSNMAVLEKRFLAPPGVWTSVLQAVGFRFLEEGCVDYPQAGSALLPPVLYVCRALAELEDEALLTLATLTSQHARPLLYVLTQSIKKKKMDISDSALKPLYEGLNPGQALLADLGFAVNSEGAIVPPCGEMRDIQGASRAIYALFWDASFKDCGRESGCVLL